MILKTCILAVIFLVSMQSCTVYQKTSVALSNAHNKGLVKVESRTGEVHRFENIELRDSTYYGLSIKSIENKDGLYEQVQYYTSLTDEQVNGVYLRDKKKSKKRTILLATSPVIIFGSYIAVIITLLLFGVLSIV